MPEQVLDTEETLDKLDDDSTPEQVADPLADLPDDPAERNRELEARLRDQAKEARRIARDNERLAKDRDEQRERGDYWYAEGQRVKAQPRDDDNPASRREKAPEKKPLPSLDVSEWVADEDHGFEKLVEAVREHSGLLTREEYAAEQRKNRETLRKTEEIRSALAKDYPDLNDPGSELLKESMTQFEALADQQPNAETDLLAETAINRAARKLGVVPGGKRKVSDTDDIGHRKASNAFGPNGRRGTVGTGKGQITDELRRMAQRTAGEALPDSVLQRVADATAKANETRRRAS